MGWITVLFAALSFATKMIPVAEKAFDDVADSGEQKKEMVMTGVEALVNTIEGVSTGGQAKTWNRIEEPIGECIDAACDVLFPHEERKTP